MKFTDTKRDSVPISVQNVEELQYEDWSSTELLNCIEIWSGREDKNTPGSEFFELENTRSFVISYDGKASHYWPGEDENFTEESLIREFLFHEGICQVTSLELRLFRVNYSIVNISDDEYLLVCPFNTESGNIAGIVVVCLTKLIKAQRRTRQ